MSGFAQLNQILAGGFQGLPLNGTLSQQELGDLMKALTVGADRDPPASYAAGDGFAFRTEDLDPLARTSTYSADEIVLWKMLQKTAAENTVVEWNDVESYGEDGYDGFMGEGSLPELMDSVVSRQFAFVKYLGIQGAVSHQATTVKAAGGNLIAQETERKMLKLLELTERSLFYGSSALDAGQWDGYFTQIQNAVTAGRAPSSVITDLRGLPLTITDIENMAADAASEPRYGRLSDAFFNPKVKSNLNASQFPAMRSQQGVNSGPGGSLGGQFRDVQTSVGSVNIHSDSFIHFGRRASATGLGDAARRPSTPILAVAPTSPVDATAQFIATDAGDYTYSVVARNRFGASVPLSIGSVTVVAGDHVEFGIQAAPGQPTLYFEVFRSTRNGGASTVQLIARIANPSAGGGFSTVTVIDRNADLPGTSMGMVVDWKPTVLNFKQLAPFMKIMLGQMDLNIRWVQCVYGTPVLFLPKKVQLVKNIGLAA